MGKNILGKIQSEPRPFPSSVENLTLKRSTNRIGHVWIAFCPEYSLLEGKEQALLFQTLNMESGEMFPRSSKSPKSYEGWIHRSIVISPFPAPVCPVYVGRWWDCTLCPWKETAQISKWALQHSTWKNLGQQLRVSRTEQWPECRSHKSQSTAWFTGPQPRLLKKRS